MGPADRAELRKERRGRAALIASGTAFGLFCANVIAGKASMLMGAAIPWHIGNVAEFVLLVLAVICFVVAILEKERARSNGAIN